MHTLAILTVLVGTSWYLALIRVLRRRVKANSERPTQLAVELSRAL